MQPSILLYICLITKLGVCSSVSTSTRAKFQHNLLHRCDESAESWLWLLTRILTDGGHRAADGGVGVCQRVRRGEGRQVVLELYGHRRPGRRRKHRTKLRKGVSEVFLIGPG